jgi:acyl-CoA synthetase (AMP-forming)/AMP-acid ligase II
MNENIYKIFELAANDFPNNIAIIDNNKQITYNDLKLAVNNKGIELNNKGITQGDKILVFIPMSIELYIFLLATFKTGAVAVFVDEWANKKRLTDCLTKVPCKGFAGNNKALLLRFFYTPLRKISVIFNNKYIFAKSHETALQEVKPNETALVTFTTGSTSIPKAANRTHQFLNAQYLTLSKELKTKSNDIDLIGLPIVVLCNLGTGATSVLPNYNLKKLDSFNPEKIISYIKKHNINRIINSPSFFMKIGKNKQPLTHISHIFTGGAPVFPSSSPSLKQAFPNAEIDILYGSTEAEPISKISNSDLLLEEQNLSKDGLCVGKVSEDVQIKIIKGYEQEIINPKELQSLAVKAGEVGEILVAGDHVLKEYLNSDIDTLKNKIKQDETVWHRTGDAGKIIDHKLYLQGRTNQLFKKNNELISPFIYEYLLNLNEHIISGTVLYSKNVVAYIQTTKNANKNELTSLILNQFPVIEKVVFISKMPLDPRHNSKIDYEKIKTKHSH